MTRSKRRKSRKSKSYKPKQPGRRSSPAIPSGVRFAITPAIGTDGRVPKAAQPKPTEPMFLHLAVLVEEREPESKEELEALISRYMVPGQKPNFPPPTQPWHQAQDVAYQGWELKRLSERKRAKSVRQALEVSPDAVDGYLLLAHDAPSWEEATDLCTQAMAAAERLLGPDFLTEYKDDFWGMALTRPYMRARFALGYCLWRQGKREEALAHFRGLISLNQDDNQGARYVLAAILLELGEGREARQVMGSYSPDALCHWAYNRALIEFRQRGDQRRAQKLLRKAFGKNALVPVFLLGRRRIRSYELDIVEPGEEGEAIEYQHLYGGAWAMAEGALEWLEQQFEA
ncbi:MAG: tetratricopeptide repeat protein [Anaerolineae bacterium]